MTLKDLRLTGTLMHTTPLRPPGMNHPVRERDLLTDLPSFQGAGLLGKLRNKDVRGTVKPRRTTSALAIGA